MSWMSQLSWKEGLSPSVLKEIDKIELEVERLQKEKSIKALQFETLEAALDKKQRKFEEEKSISLGFQRDLQNLNEQIGELRTKFDKQSLDLSSKERQLISLQGSLESKNKALESVQFRVRSLEKSLDYSSLAVANNSSDSVFMPGNYTALSSPKCKESNPTIEELRIKLENAEEIIRKRDQLIEELKESNSISLSIPDLFNSSPNTFAQRNRSSSIVFNEVQSETKSTTESAYASFASPTAEIHREEEGRHFEREQQLQEALLKISELESRIKEDECKLYNVDSCRLSLEKRMKEMKEEDSLALSEMKKRDLEIFEAENRKLEKRFEEEKNTLTMRIEDLTAQMVEAENGRAILENNISELKNQLMDKVKNESKLCQSTTVPTSNEMELMEEELLSKDAIIKNLENLLQIAKSENTDLNKLEHGNDEVQTLVSKLEATEDKLTSYETDIQSLKDENNTLINEKTSLQYELNSLKENFTVQLDDLKKTYETRLEEEAQVMEKIKDESSKCETHLSKLTLDMDNLRKEHDIALAEKENEVKEMKTQLKNFESQSHIETNQLKKEFETIKEALSEEKLSELNRLEALWKEKIQERENEITSQLTNLQEALESKERELNEFHSQVDNLNSEKSSLSNKVNELETMMNLNSENLKTKESELEGNIQRLVKSLEEVNLKLEEKESMVDRISGENVTLKDKIDQLRVESLSSESEFRDVKEELSQLKEYTLISLQDSLNKAEERILILTSENEEKLKKCESSLTSELQEKLSCHQETLSMKESELQDLNTKYQLVKESLEEEKKDKLDLSEKLNEKLRDMLILQDNFNLQIMTLEEDKSELEKKIQIIQEKDVFHLEKIETLQTENERLSSSSKELECKVDALQKEKGALNEEQSQALSMSESLRMENEKLLSDLEKFESDHHETLLQLDSLKDELNLKSEDFESKVSELTSKLTNLEDSLETKENQFFEVREKLENCLQSHKEELQDIKGDHDSKVKDLEAQILGLNESLTILENEKKGYISKIDVLRRDSSAVADSIEKSNQQLLQLRSEYEQSLSEAETEKASLIDEISELKSKYHSVLSEYEELKNEVQGLRSLKEELTDTQKSLKNKEFESQEGLSKIQSLELKLEKLQNTVEKLQEANIDSEKYISDRELELKEVQSLNEELGSEVKDLNNQILDFESKYDSLDEEAQILREEKEVLKKEVEETANEMVTKLAEATQSFESDRSALLQSIAESENNIKELKSVISNLTEEKSKLLKDCENSTSSLVQTQSSLDAAENHIKSLEVHLQEKTSEAGELLNEKETLRKQVLDSDMAIESLITKEKELLSSAEEFQKKLSTLSDINEENEYLKKGLTELEQSASELKSNLEALNNEKEELKNLHDKTVAEMNATHAKEKEKIMEKLRSLETSKEDETEGWKSKVKSLLSNLKRKEKAILSLQSINSDLKSSLFKERGDADYLPWEKESTKDDYKDLSPLDLLYLFKDDEELSHKARLSLYSGAWGSLQADLDAKMDRNIQLVKELGEAKTEIDKLKFKYEELPKMNKVKSRTEVVASSSSNEEGGGGGVQTRSGTKKRKSVAPIDSENFPPVLRNDTGLPNPFKKRSLIKPATLKVTKSVNSRPLNTITNQDKTLGSK